MDLGLDPERVSLRSIFKNERNGPHLRQRRKAAS
jgi:hypothetical protein